MWFTHFLLFRGTGIAAWFGSVVVAENIVSSTVHSHLFDFDQGWLYVFGVGVLAGMVLKRSDAVLAPREHSGSSTPNTLIGVRAAQNNTH